MFEQMKSSVFPNPRYKHIEIDKLLDCTRRGGACAGLVRPTAICMRTHLYIANMLSISCWLDIITMPLASQDTPCAAMLRQLPSIKATIGRTLRIISISHLQDSCSHWETLRRPFISFYS